MHFCFVLRAVGARSWVALGVWAGLIREGQPRWLKAVHRFEKTVVIKAVFWPLGQRHSENIGY